MLGPLALLEFKIWNQSEDNLDVDSLIDKLTLSVRHSLWDVVMEYDVLTHSVIDGMSDEDVSQPHTPHEGEQSVDQYAPLGDAYKYATQSSSQDGFKLSSGINIKFLFQDLYHFL